jgi:signal transduction histidine kinase/DNA-binding response OmpR family regulator/CHASE3 domain sensor protein
LRVIIRGHSMDFLESGGYEPVGFRRVVELAIKSESGTEANGPRAFLARRLTLAIATPIGVLVVLGAILGRQILEMSEDSRWVEHTDQVRGATIEALLEIIDQETAVRGYLLTEDRRFLEPVDRGSPRERFPQLRALVADNPSQQARFELAQKSYEHWLAAVTPVLAGRDLSAERSHERVLERKARMDKLRVVMREAIAVEDGLRRTRVAASAASTLTTEVLFLVLLLVSAALLAFISRRQLSSIASMFGAALDAETRARQATEDEAWIRAGQARLVEAMQGEQTVPQLGDKCLTVLAEYTRASVGAFFSKEPGSWRRRAGHALDSRAAGPDSFADGEGLIGKAALTGRLLDLRELPPDFLRLRSGTGEASPSQLVVVPACLDGTANAVIELGFLGSADVRSLELLGRVGESVAVAVRSSDYKQRLRELLEETQRQAEELQTQQEELRVQNEELEHQSRLLQESKGRLENQQSELEQINSQLEEQTQALEGQRDDLVRARGELQRASDYKSQFLANMSHELRTPLNSSLILAKLLADNRDGNLQPEQVKFAQTIYSSGNDLLTLINDILDLSRIEAGKLDIRPVSVPLAGLVAELSNTFGPIAREKGLELSAIVEPGVPDAVYTDPTRLAQILKNLLSNALKFSERGGVTLRVHQPAEGELAFDVIDTGIGIPREQQEVVFDAFRQADGTTNRKYGGTGLGLSISRDLARLLGGELSLESAPGQGSTFSLRLPQDYAARAEEPRPASLAPRPMAAAEPPARIVLAPAQAARAPQFQDDRARLAAGARAILVIEDDPSFARILYDLAHELDFHALLAHSGEEGLAMAERYRPSAIVLDMGLPDRSGLSVLDALKHNSATRHIPVHIVSASDYEQPAREMGAAGYAIKPVTREQLVDALKRLEAKFEQRLRRILVVEDDDVMRESTCRLLGGGDVETVAVGTAAEALSKLGESTFDCMVLDLSLPDRPGLDVLEEISQKEQYGFPPVIVYTGRSLSRVEEQQLRRFSQSIIIKGARSPERLLDEVTLFLHQVESDLPADRQRMLRDARHREELFEGRRILLVEDDVRNVFALTSVLEPKGARVEIARNGREAVAHLKNNPGVDLVLMDIMMPEMDGLQATRAIRKQPEHAKLPIIALTAKAMSDDRENCLLAGANDYIAKPLDIDKLLSLVRVWMPR